MEELRKRPAFQKLVAKFNGEPAATSAFLKIAEHKGLGQLIDEHQKLLAPGKERDAGSGAGEEGSAPGAAARRKGTSPFGSAAERAGSVSGAQAGAPGPGGSLAARGKPDLSGDASQGAARGGGAGSSSDARTRGGAPAPEGGSESGAPTNCWRGSKCRQNGGVHFLRIGWNLQWILQKSAGNFRLVG